MQQQRQSGFSMLEVIISSMLIGVVMVAALDSAGSAMLAMRLKSEQIDADTLAFGLMSEIMAMPYEDPDTTATVVFGTESDESPVGSGRTSFDDLDDYRGWSSAPVNRDGTPIPGTTGWLRAAEVKKISWANPTLVINDNNPEQGIRRVSVTVTDPDGVATVIRAIRSKYGATEQLPALDSDVVTTITVSLTAGDAASVSNTGSVANHASGP